MDMERLLSGCLLVEDRATGASDVVTGKGAQVGAKAAALEDVQHYLHSGVFNVLAGDDEIEPNFGKWNETESKGLGHDFQRDPRICLP
jgi:hypothetical protein